MKIKCPACQAVLNIPDSAAGKVVKCPCGKQLRAPGVSSTPVQPPAQPQRPTPQRPTPQRPTPQRPAQPSGDGFDPGIFDELTDQDLQPVSAVNRPGHAPPPRQSAAGDKLMQQYAPTGQQGGRMNTGNMQIASVGARIGGALMDVAVQLIAVIAGLGLIFLSGAISENGNGPDVIGFIAIGVAVLIFLTPAVINIVFICMYGQSIGKKLVGTRMVVEATGEVAGFVHGFLLRQIVFSFCTSIPLIGGFVAIADVFFLFSENAQTLHDRLAGTVVINA